MPPDLAVPAVNIGGDRELGHFRSAEGFEEYLRLYRAGMAALPPFTFQDVATTFGTVRTYRFGGPDGTPVLLLPGRNASTPMYGGNLPPLLAHRTVYCVDLLGEAGLSVQRRRITGAEDQAQWLDETLAGLGLDRVHLLGVSFGGWSATNAAARRPGRAESLALLDPVLTFARLPITTVLASVPMAVPGVPEALRRRALRWISGGAELEDAEPVASLIASGGRDFVLRTPIPRRIPDDRLRGLDIPVLALIAGRSVIHDAHRAAERARKVLARGQVELWPQASHAINGEYPDEIAEVASTFWAKTAG
ncbi:carboxylesterase [Mycolicibacterium chitae]|uniref:Carboxylesterase n=1 Tax=Mycolicibacterium chitae TaxID=1792 RepID=A0A448IAC7_MYCCI|nr:alpha/beta hydrolase [Mycolicibacterium chitae]MCV7107781.1 alpha/beta hydrolase [Mycolicibacterium chitae]BBZ05782.1 carboxylesterase [Mycolicibacterium chitae]VEG49392.1 carboxylesterase [Mycolicibacterium chitae]